MEEVEKIELQLEKRFALLCQELKIRNGPRVWELIRRKYQEKHRHYHTLRHLQELFGLRDEYADYLEKPACVELAIFFHDIIYEVRGYSGGRNEVESARLFDLCMPDLDTESREVVKKMIVHTIDHRCSLEKDGSDTCYFNDFDIAVLGKDEVYDIYAAKIRKEYKHIQEALWCLARGRFLEHSAQSRHIFATPQLRDRFEVKARANLRREAAALQKRFYQCGFLARFLARILCLVPMLPRVSKRVFSWQYLLSPIIAPGFSFGPCRLTCALFIIIGLSSSSIWHFFARLTFACSFIFLYMLIPIIFRAFKPLHNDIPHGVAIFAGSWNPPHQGHIAILRSLAARHLRVYAVVAANPAKEYKVSADTRKALLERLVDTDPKLAGIVVVKIHMDYVWKLALPESAVLYRGIRSWKLDGIAELFLLMQNVIGPVLLAHPGTAAPVQTHFFYSSKDLAHISSSSIRRRLQQNSNADLVSEGLLPVSIAKDVARLYT